MRNNVNCGVKRYLCTNCNELIYMDISFLVESNSNIVISVKSYVLEMYALYNPSFYKIKKYLERNPNVNILERSIHNICFW